MLTRARSALLAVVLAAPAAASASGSGLDYLDGVLAKFADAIINPLIRGIFAAALIMFFWGVLQFIRGGSPDEKGKNASLDNGKRHMLWGIVGMAIMVSVFAIIKLATGQIGVTPDFSF